MPDSKSYLNFRTVLFFLLVLPLIVGANIALWAAVNRPHQTESWVGEIVGLSYSPYRIGQDPFQGITIGPGQLDEDMSLLSTKVQAIRTYSTTNGLDAVPDIAKKYNLSVSVGAWIGSDKERNEEEIELLKKVAFRKNVVRVLVGNEAALRNEVTVPELIEYIRKVKNTVWKPVSTAEPWHLWLAHPELAREVDFIGVQILPYWEGVSVETAVDFVFARLKELKAAFPNKPIVITEVGWPSRGRIIPRRYYDGMSAEEANLEAVPSLVNQAGFLRVFLNRAKEEKLTYYVMEAFDQPWKSKDEGLAGGYWGIFNALRKPKFPLVGQLDEYAMWRIWASVAAGLALIPAVVFALGRQQVRPVGQVFFAVLAQLAGSGIAWSGLSVTGIYLTHWEVALWTALFFSQGLLLIVLITEAVELVEVLWMRHGERQFKPLRNAAGDHPTAKVSVHVPIHNEPPDMVFETLDALSRLDYKNFEVLVIDNNTKDAATWQPVEQRCAELGPRFRFFHLDPWPGYKAGALNFAITQTAPDSEIIAVIDSDYKVEPDWLSSLVPYFAKPDVAFVQAPQDYRDGGENRFKTMCYWEYAGFFHIGMVQRNNFNAVIQHGTMTLVRKTALQKVGGWAEWCICEDAELGVKLYREGYDSVYVNVSFGKGLTPDTIGAYMSQRFRWAYGAVQILKRHWRAIFLPLESKRLTRAQSYYFFAGWLPWFADSLALLFTFASIGLSIWALMQPRAAFLPVAAFMIPTIGSFAFKFIRSLWLYAIRVHCSFLDSLGAAMAALSLTHTVAKAILSGLFTSGRPFFRTPKCEDKPALAAAFLQVREEALMLVALWSLAAALFFNPEFYDKVSRLWVVVLLVQSSPYAASVFLSFVNAFVTRRDAGAELIPAADKAG
ncbi:MAG: glycosyltransferase [Nitrospinae bacterium]|nr:glycosyltransferase [Nitrospinota bacterium]